MSSNLNVLRVPFTPMCAYRMLRRVKLEVIRSVIMCLSLYTLYNPKTEVVSLLKIRAKTENIDLINEIL